MSYDPSDEVLESLFSDIVKTFDGCPPRLKKRVFSGLVDEIALRNVMLEENKIQTKDTDLAKYREEQWGKVEEMRLQLAGRLLYSLMSEELP
jgi:hypothetical protein